MKTLKLKVVDTHEERAAKAVAEIERNIKFLKPVDVVRVVIMLIMRSELRQGDLLKIQAAVFKRFDEWR
jgi:hypothetical protein